VAGVFFLAVGAFWVWLGLWLGTRGLGLAWLGVSFLVLGVAYALDAPALLGKRRDGTVHPAATWVLAPLKALSWLTWQLRRQWKEPCWNEVVPGLFLGRRPADGELPPGVELVVDLTSELRTPAAVRGSTYRCAPTLDGRPPQSPELSSLVAEVASASGPVFVFCMAGHGRSATVVAGAVIARGLAHDVASAVALLRRTRPGVWLTSGQRSALEALRSGEG